MVEFNRQDRVVKVKIAYYGPAVCGKTTNLRVLYERARSGRRGEFVSVNSQQDRTILCDLLPIRSTGYRGFDLRFQLAAVPGQAIYAAARRVVLRGSDGIVFVANSATDRFHENVQALRELQGHLASQQLDPSTIPMVLQYNKRDLPDVLAPEALDRGLNARRLPAIPATATRGEGVLETFAAIVSATLEDLARRYSALAPPPGETIAEWTEQAVLSMFGTTQLSEGQPDEDFVTIDVPDEALFDEASSTRHALRLPIPEEAAKPAGTAAGGEARPADFLAETYAQASTVLGLQVNDLREERNLARSRLAELRIALQLAEKGSEGELEDRAQRILSILMRSADATNASLLLTTTDPPQVLVLPPLVSDPLARTPWGAQHLHELRALAEPRLEEGSSLPELATTLGAGEPAFESVALVPFRSADRVLALALLYYPRHATLPTPDALNHVGFLARILAGPLEAAAAREAAASVERMRALSHASAAAMASVLTRLPAGSVRNVPLVLDDLLGPLRVPGVTVTVVPGTPGIRGDASLLRYAVSVLVSRCEAVALERAVIPVIGVYAGSEEGFVRLHVWLGEGAAAVGAVVPQGFSAEADTEMTAVYAIMALHDGGVVAPESGRASHFVLQFRPGPAAA